MMLDERQRREALGVGLIVGGLLVALALISPDLADGRNWIGPAGAEHDAGPGTDFHAVRRGFISVTPIHVDLTRYQALDQVAGWVSAISTRADDSMEGAR